MDTLTKHEQTIFEQGMERERKRIVGMLDEDIKFYTKRNMHGIFNNEIDSLKRFRDRIKQEVSE